MEELPGVLWAIITSLRGITNETPFSLVYEIKSIIPIEVRLPTMRSDLTKDQNSSERAIEFVLAKDKRDQALRKIVEQKRSVIDYYNKVIRFIILYRGLGD